MKLMKQLSARAEMQIRSIELCLLSQFDLCSAIGLIAAIGFFHAELLFFSIADDQDA